MRYCAPMKTAVLLLAACATQSTPQPQPQQFVAKVNQEAKKYAVEAAIADWIKSTYITDDTERNDATANERLLAYSTEAIEFFIAEDLTHVGQQLDDGELLDVAEMTSAELLAALDRGELTDAKTVAALFMYLRRAP